MAKQKTHEPKGSQVEKHPPALAGIDFVEDEDPRTIDRPDPGARPVEQDRANQQAAREALQRMGGGLPQVAAPVIELPPLSDSDARRLAPKVFRVVGDHKIAKGGSTYVLKAGKFVDTRNYDVDSLRAQGVQLVEVEQR